MGELARALAMPHRLVSAALGSHAFAGTSTVETREAGTVVDVLSDTTAIEIDADGRFHAALANSKDYGREAFWTDGTLYLRPRWGKFHRRPANDADEPLQIRDEIFATLGAYFELVAAGSEISDKGAVQHAGRAARKVEIKLAPSARAAPPVTGRQRAWRADAVVKAVTGEIVLDAESGAPLAGSLDAVVAFNRDGRGLEMHLVVSHAISAIGQPHPIGAPPLGDTVATPTRLKEVEDRDLLLKGIAPPTRSTGAGAEVSDKPRVAPTDPP